MKNFIVWLASSFRRIIVAYVLTFVVCAGAFSVLEDKGFGDSLWYTGVTALTIGYGDMYAVTPAGRILMLFFAHVWVFGIAPLVVVNIINAFVQDKNEFSHEEQEEIKNLLRELAKQRTIPPTDNRGEQA